MSANGKSVIIPPAQGTFGNMRPGSLIGAPFHEWDLSLRKKWKIRERLSLEASISAFNVLNSRTYTQGLRVISRTSRSCSATRAGSRMTATRSTGPAALGKCWWA